MMRLLPTISLSIVVLSSAVAAQAEPSVLEAYREIQGAGVAPDLSYEVAPAAGGGYQTTSPDWGTPMPVEVDGANGWMQIADEGTGGGSFETQVVLWRQADGTPLVGIAETAYDPPYPMNTRVRFFGFDTQAWDEWTDYSWPGVELADFLRDDNTIADLRALEATRASVYVSLPRHGPNPVAHLVTRTEEIDAVCGGQDWFVPADRAPYLTYCVNLEGHVARNIELAWDRVAVQFTQGPARK